MKSVINSNRWIPSNHNCHIDYMQKGEDFVFANCEIFYTEVPVNGKVSAIAFVGKGKNSSWYYSFKNVESMKSYIDKFIEECKYVENYKLIRKEKQKMANASISDTVKVGDLFHYSWGYDQTNCEFYQVIAVKGKTATLQRISSKSVPNTQGFMSEQVSPMKDAFIQSPYGDDVIKKRIQASYDGKPYFSMSFGSLTQTTENSTHYSSWYA